MSLQARRCPEIFIENESSTEANVRVKFYSNDQERVSSGSSGVLRFVNESGVRGVQVEAKSVSNGMIAPS